MNESNARIGSDLAKVDAHEITPEEYDEIPELDDDFFDRAEIRHGNVIIRPASGTLTRRGRPPSPAPKRHVTLRLDADLLDRFRAEGPGWQSRINAALRKAAGL